MRRALPWVGWALLWGAAAAGVALSVAALLASLPATRSYVARALVRVADDAIAGTMELEGVSVHPKGGVELRGLRVFDPEGGLVLSVDRARVFADLFGIPWGEVGVSAALEGVEADAARRGEDGRLAIARAFAPAARAPRPPRAPKEAEPEAPAAPPGGWTVRVARLSIARARIVAEGAGAEPIDLGGVGLEARGSWGPREAWLEARLGGALAAPVEAPLSVALRAVRDGDRVELQRLEVGLGSDRLEAVGEGDLARRTGRLAVTRLGVSGSEAGAFAPTARIGEELSGTLYAESDGAIVTAALRVAPPTAGGDGRAEVAAAARVPPAAFAWGAFAEVDRLDPSRFSLLAPSGRVTLRGRGAASGTRLATLAGRLDVRLERSRLRGGELGPVELVATAGGGAIDVTRLEAAAPGGTAGGRLRWREGSQVSGELTVVASDLEVLEKNLTAILGRSIPDLEGSGRASVTLSGTSQAPHLDAKVDAARLGVGSLRAEGARLRVELQGPTAAFSGRVKGGLEKARVGGLELRGVALDASVREEEGSLAFTAHAPQLGSELVRATLRGRFSTGRSHFELQEGLLSWPGTVFALARPARVGLTIPGVDRLILASDAQRVEVVGGLDRSGKLEARLRLQNLDLARLPRGLAPPGADFEGLLTIDARASGTREAPRVDATIGLTGASAWDVGGLQLLGEATWDGELERVEADLGLVRERGGAIDLSFDLPLALGRARAYEELRVELRGQAVPLDELVWLAGSYALVSGDVDLEATLTGSVGAPALRATVAVRNGTWDDLEELGLEGTVDAPGDRLRIDASWTLAGAAAGSGVAKLALDLSKLLARPREAIAAARRGPLDLTLRIPSVSIRPLAGRLKLPADLDGRLDAEANLGGSLAAPRGTARIALEGAAGWGARAVTSRMDVALAPERSGIAVELRLAGKPAARLDGTIDLPSERLLDRAAIAAAPFRAEATIPRSELAAWGGEILALQGTVEGRAALRGTPGAPQGELSFSATDAVVERRPLGAVAIDARYAARRTTASLDLSPPAGGTLRAEGVLDHPLGRGAGAGPILEAPVEVRVRAERLDLGFLPALAPGVVRAAAGAATLDLAAAGPLGELRPRGTFRVAKGRLAVAELGEWTDAAIEADLGADVIELKRFDVRKGTGRLWLHGSLRGVSRPREPMELEAKLRSDDFGIERAGMEFARFELTAEARGQLTREALTLGVVVPQAEVKLPKRLPRTLQDLGTRRDITVGRPRPPRSRRAPPVATSAAGADGTAAVPAPTPFRTVVHLVAPRRLRVRADQPRIDVELKADALFAFAGSHQEATGTVTAIRGRAEPIGGRVFELERGKVTFTGGPISSGVLDVAARYDNPAATVHAIVAGTLSKPKLTLTSVPPMDEARIAMLVATGRTEVKAGAGGVNTLAAGEAGLAAAGAFMTGVFKDLLSDKLPVDSVSLDSTAVSAGKYLTDRIYVGYARRFDAKPEKGENADEVRIEYQLAPGWQVETRYGSGQSGGASIVWTRSY